MTKLVLWSSSAGDVPANLAFTNNFAATADPTASNDISQGYTAGSVWLNTTTRKAFTCMSSLAGAAVWQLGGQQAGETQQGAPAALTTSATMTAANLLAGIITSNQGASGAAAYQLPLAADLDAALPYFAVNDAFDFSLIGISTDAAEDATITTNTGWTLVGSMVVASNAAATDKSAGQFRARKTAAGAWTLYRIS